MKTSARNSFTGKVSAIRSGNMGDARSRFLQYTKAGGQDLPGLVNRRQTEASWFGGAAPTDDSPEGARLAASMRPQQAPASSGEVMLASGRGTVPAGAAGVILVGLDTPSVDLEQSKELESHHAIHRHDMAILEGVVLSGVEEGLYTLIALPLRMEHGDASPVRAILVSEFSEAKEKRRRSCDRRLSCPGRRPGPRRWAR